MRTRQRWPFCTVGGEGSRPGILPRGITLLGARWGTDPRHLLVHLGPAICGACYTVGPEVFSALGMDDPSHAAPVDVRSVLAQQARAAGVPARKHHRLRPMHALRGRKPVLSSRRTVRAAGSLTGYSTVSPEEVSGVSREVGLCLSCTFAPESREPAWIGLLPVWPLWG